MSLGVTSYSSVCFVKVVVNVTQRGSDVKEELYIEGGIIGLGCVPNEYI